MATELYRKALSCAIQDLKQTRTREDANRVYRKWEVFHKNKAFKEAVKEKQKSFERIK